MPLRFRQKRLGIHTRTRPQFLHPFDDYSFPAIEAVGDYPLAPHTITDYDSSNAHLITAIDHGYLVAALEF